jgi:hypothetical protein
MSQNEQILAYLKTGKHLTPLEALMSFNCFRLAARIKDLRDQGHQIETTIIEDNEKRWAAYWIKKARDNLEFEREFERRMKERMAKNRLKAKKK